jgi:hypothetical protein
MKRIVLSISCLAFSAGVSLAQVEAPAKPGDSPHSDGRTVSPEVRGVEQPQGTTGPTTTTTGGAPAESPQGQTPPGMQAAPDGSRKTVEEPSDTKGPSRAQSAAPAPQPSSVPQPSAVGIFERGVLTVAGADPDNQTAPAKYSKRTDAADQLPIAEYALKHLNRDQRSRIYLSLHKSMAISGKAPEVERIVGAEINSNVVLQALQALPDDITRDIPELKGLGYVRDDNTVLIVSPTMHRVLAVLEP